MTVTPKLLASVAGIVALALAGAGSAARTDPLGRIQGRVVVDGIPADGTAIVFLEKAAGHFAPPSQPAVLDQKDLKFVPHVLPILFGTTVKFVNSDRVPHSVFSPDHETYNLGTWSPGQSKTYTFSKDCKTFPCVYTQLCALHSNMEAFIVVLDNPHFVRTDSQGNFTLEGVPAGEHQVGVWAPDAKVASQAVTVKAGATTTVNFMLSGR
jgi:plastocyanin